MNEFSQPNNLPETDVNPTYIIRSPQMGDISDLKPILEYWVKDRDTGEPLPQEVDEIVATIESNIQGTGGNCEYVVAEVGGKAVGVMGMAEPIVKMAPLASTDKSAELINAFVDPQQKNDGIGKLLFHKLEQTAKGLGYKEFIVNSGPRYRDSGWAFWEHLFGERSDTIKELYGVGGDAPVWRKQL